MSNPKFVHLTHHYVVAEVEGGPKPPGANCTPDRLRQQVTYLLDEGYEFLTCGEIARRVRNGLPLPDQVANLTFDDMLKSQWRESTTLNQLGVQATFFCNSGPLVGVIPGPILFQMLIAYLGAERLERDILPDAFAGVPYLDLLDPTRYDLRDRKSGEPEELRRIKTMVNDFIPQKFKMQQLGRIFAEYVPAVDRAHLLNRWFIPQGELAPLSKMGHEIAGHTHDHPALDIMADAEIEEQLDMSNRLLSGVVGKPIASFAYTFGGNFRPNVRKLVMEHHESAWNYHPKMTEIPSTAYDDLSDIPRLNGVGFPFK